MNIGKCLALVSIFLFSGCADLTTFHRVDYGGDGVQIISMDAKQRVLISSSLVEETPVQKEFINEKTHAPEKRIVMQTKTYRRFCAEPSPDALSALAASLGVDLSVAGKGDLGVNQAMSEGVASIGIRTSAIQTLRDITYRDCEAYINGGVTRFGLETLQRRFQSTLVAILAIEQLTGAVRAPNIALTAQTSGNDSESLSKISDQATKAKSTLDAAKAVQSAADEKVTTANAAQKALEAKIAADKSSIETIEKKSEDSRTATEKADLANYKKSVADLDSAKKTSTSAIDDAKKAASVTVDKQADFDAQAKIRNAALVAAGSTSINALFSQLPVTQTLDTEAVKALAETTERIVSSTLGLGFGREACTTVFGYIVERDDLLKTAQTNSLALKCIEYLDQDIASAKANSAMVTAQANFANQLATNLATLIQKDKLSADQLLTLINTALKPAPLVTPLSKTKEIK